MAIDYEIKGKVAIVCGASSGIGRASAMGLAEQGVNVLLISRSQDKLDKTKKEIEAALGVTVVTLAGDVTDTTLAQKAADLAIKELGSVDILVNNAGGPPMGSFLEKSQEDWDLALSQNLTSVVRFTRAVAEPMIKQNWGRIINITSTLAKEPSAPMVLSATARAGVSAFSKSVSIELAPKGVTINTLCPGGVLTGRLHALLETSAVNQCKEYDQVLKESQATIPIGRFAEPEEFADMLVFLASERGRYVTGTSIMVDGGLSKGIF